MFTTTRIFMISSIVLATVCVLGARAGAQSAAEKLFAELAQPAVDQRHARIIEGAKKEGEINMISSLRGKLGRGHIKLFRERYPFLKVNMSEMGSQDAAERLFAEEVAGRHLTDVIGLGVPDMAELISKDIAANYPTPANDRILKQYREFMDPKNRWTTWSQSEHGIVYNTNLVKQPPKTWQDLCDPQFKGKTSFDPSETRFLIGLYYLFEKNFEKVGAWLECVGKNKPIIQRGHTARLMLMLSGDHTISPDQYFYRGTQMKHKNPEVPFGADYQPPVMVYGQAHVINKNTPHPNTAALFVDWALTDESQHYMAKNYRGPVAGKHPYFPDDVKLVPFNFVSNEIVDRLHGLWSKYLGSR